MNNNPALTIQRQPSRRLAVLLCAMHMISFGLLWPLIVPFALKVAITALLIVSLIYYLRQDALLTADHAVTAFTLTGTLQCTVTLRSGEAVTGTVQGGTFVAPCLTVILYRPEGKFFARSIVIFPDGIDAEAFRKLRVWLRWRTRESH